MAYSTRCGSCTASSSFYGPRDSTFRSRARGLAPSSPGRNSGRAVGRHSCLSGCRRRRPAGRRRGDCPSASCGCCPSAPARCTAPSRRAVSRGNRRSARAPCRASCRFPPLRPTTPANGSRCRRRAPPAAPEPRPHQPAHQRPRRRATPSTAAPWKHPGRGAWSVAKRLDWSSLILPLCRHHSNPHHRPRRRRACRETEGGPRSPGLHQLTCLGRRRPRTPGRRPCGRS